MSGASHGYRGIDPAPDFGGYAPGIRRVELVNDVLVPIVLVAMMWCVGSYGFAVREALLASGNSVLRFVYFFFLVGVVGIAKMRSVRGSEAVAAPYVGGLALAVAVFLANFSGVVGGIAGSLSFAGAFVSNLALFAVVWAGVNWITRDCTVDPESENAATHSMFDAVARDRRRPGRSVLMFSLLAACLFGLGQIALSRSNEDAYRTGFLTAGAYTASALTLLSLTNLSGLRLYLAGRKVHLPGRMVPYWLLFSLAVIGTVLALAWLLPKPEGRAGELIKRRGQTAAADARMAMYGPPSGWSQGPYQQGPFRPGDVRYGPPRPDRWGQGPPLGGAQRPQADRSSGARTSGGGPEQGEGTQTEAAQETGTEPESSGEEQQSADASAESGAPTDDAASAESPTQGGASGEEAATSSREERPEGQTAATEWQPPPAPPLDLSSFSDCIRIAAIAIGVLLGLYLLWRVGSAVCRMMLGRSWRLPRPRLSWPRGRRRPADGDLALLRNPFSDLASLAQADPRELVLRTYAAFMALARLCGSPRPPHITALEFSRNLPIELAALRAEATELSELYVRAEYDPSSDLSPFIQRLRAIWERMDSYLEARLHPAESS